MILQNKNIMSVKSALLDLPTPSSISYWWNFGSLLGICLLTQIITGLFLSFHYISSVFMAFESVVHLVRDVWFGIFIRILHANGASVFFIFAYLHVYRGGLMQSFIRNGYVWASGTLLLLALMAISFLGYVLPWGQMSFWGATVITNLISAVPYLGGFLVEWVWGGFSVSGPTLTRFFSLHFILPFILVVLVIIHLILLHSNGSSTPIGATNKLDRVYFSQFFVSKDLLGVLLMFLFISIVLVNPNMLGDPENFSPANPMVTPPHIQPEWYFLFAYAILRSIPNKLGGVVALVSSILILLLLVFSSKKQKGKLEAKNETLWTILSVEFFLLTWIGSRPVESPYIILGQTLSLIYFLCFLLILWVEIFILKMNFGIDRNFLGLLKSLYCIVCILVSVAFFTILEQKILSYCQIRKGPNKTGIFGLLQPFSDAAKLLTKGGMKFSFSNYWFFISGPTLMLIMSSTLWGISDIWVPNLSVPSFFLFLLLILGMFLYPLIFCGWGSNSKYAQMGSFRGIAQTLSYEVSLVLFILVPVMSSGTFSLSSSFSNSIWTGLMFPGLLFCWLVVILAEANRSPLDFSEGESELVSGFNTEFMGGPFALLFISEYSMMIMMSFLSSYLFFGGVAMKKIFFVAFFFIWVRAAYPRARYDYLMSISWTVFLPISLFILSMFLLG